MPLVYNKSICHTHFVYARTQIRLDSKIMRLLYELDVREIVEFGMFI